MSRDIRTENFQSAPIIRFGKRMSTQLQGDAKMQSLLRFNRNSQPPHQTARQLLDETVLRFGRSMSNQAQPLLV
ncbi:unnamed protein product [Anisakis simplex]|uniref:Uncharacterized protein n=1 Tax=Anisakis simplex TaxID=6269 RepID=A0A3P6RTX7_ANISI|nr:unnamed protein product [Anisakis simplex]